MSFTENWTDEDWGRAALNQVRLALLKLSNDACGEVPPHAVAGMGLANLEYAIKKLNLEEK